MTIARLALLTTLFTPAVFAAPLTVDTYNPQEKGIFAVSSTLVSGPKEAVLFDAQFSVKDGEALVEKIRHSGKNAEQNRDHLRRSGFLFRPATAGESLP